jgi:cytolysin (calcineurin-like family phosphatase)
MLYSILSPYNDWSGDRDRGAFAETIADYDVVATFHGHDHTSR